MCEHITIGLYKPFPVVTRSWYPIGMINGEYHRGERIETTWKCPQCFEIITDKKYIPIREETK